MTEETLVCPNCRREVPRTIYCIYCGAVLKAEVKPKPPIIETPKMEHSEKEVRIQNIAKEAPRPTREPEVLKPVEEPEVLKPVEEPEVLKPVEEPEVLKPVKEPEIVVQTPEVEPEVGSVVKELSKYFVWEARLLGMLVGKGITEPVFVKVFKEYKEKLVPLMQNRVEKQKSYSGALTEKQNSLANSRFRLEELQVRHAVGQLEHTGFESQAPGLETEVASTEKDIGHINAQLECLADVPQGSTLVEIRELNNMVEKCYQKLPDLVETGKLSGDTEQMVLEDSDAVIAIFQSRIGQQKSDEKSLNEELAMLETRSKTGELSGQAFEKTKKEILDKIGSIWG